MPRKGGSMSSSSGSDGGAAGGGPEAGEAGPAQTRGAVVVHPRSFKLRFASQREPGRSYVSPTKPLALPATVTGKFYTRVEPTRVDERAEQKALLVIKKMFEEGPKEKYSSPLTSAHEYGWWWEALRHMEAGDRSDRRLHRPIRDSAWLKSQARLQAP